MRIPGGLDDGGANIAYAVPGRVPQPAGQSGTGRDLWDLFGEGPTRGVGLATTSGACAGGTGKPLWP